VHDHADDAEQAVGELVQDLHQGLGLSAETGEGQAEKHGEQQHLEDFTLGEGIHHTVGDDVHEEIDGALVVGCRGVVGDGLGVQGRRVHIHAGTGLQDIDHDQADGQGHGGDDFKVHQGFQADPAHFLHVAHLGDTDHHGGEDDRGDHHFDQLDEGVAQGFHGGPGLGVEGAEGDTQNDGEQHLNIQALVEGFVGHGISDRKRWRWLSSASGRISHISHSGTAAATMDANSYVRNSLGPLWISDILRC